MNMLIVPAAEHEAAYLGFAAEWAECSEEIIPYSARLLGRRYEDWLTDTARYERRETCPADFVPALTYFYADESGRILGAVNIRLALNDYLLRYGGHIGYGVRPSERRKGYASDLLAQALAVAKTRGITRVLVTCDRENIASARTILKNGGIFENEIPEGDRFTRRYWINL